MKEILFACALGITSLTINAFPIEDTAFYNAVISNIEQQSNSEWEKIGNVELVKLFKSTKSGILHLSTEGVLYVRKIGDKYFYKVIINDGAEYAVSLGRYTIYGEQYNAKAGDYYFNL